VNIRRLGSRAAVKLLCHAHCRGQPRYGNACGISRAKTSLLVAIAGSVRLGVAGECHDPAAINHRTYPAQLMNATVQTIISGGQTGADRAALDVAIELAINHGGWVPRGRWAEDGAIAACYRVQETDSPHPTVRTEYNVRDADATLIFSHGSLSGGSALTIDFARRYAKPFMHVDLIEQDDGQAAQAVTAWLAATQPAVLNVAGPRASNDPLIYDAVSRVLRRVFGLP
jgi:hypothetical protein